MESESGGQTAHIFSGEEGCRSEVEPVWED